MSQKRQATLRKIVFIVQELQEAVLNQPRLHLKDIERRYGWSRATVYRKLKRGILPKPIRFNGSLWRLKDLMEAENSRRLPDTKSI